MLDHIGIDVADFSNSKEFYTTVLKPLGYEVIMAFEDWAGLGANGKPDFWIHAGTKMTPRLHVAFHAENRAKVDAFYEAAIQAGAQDNGKPGIREDYHPNYYGAFVIDPDGHNIEAVCHNPE